MSASITLAILYGVLQSWGDLLVPISDVTFVLVSGMCSVFAFLAVRKWGFGGRFGLVYGSLFFGVFLWFFGELIWGIYELVYQISIPYPSLADLFYLAGYIPAILGVSQFLWAFKKGLTGMKLSLAGISGLLIIGLTYVFLLNPLVTVQSETLAKMFDVAYPSLDALLLILTIAMLLLFEGGAMAEGWLWISLGLLLTTVADIAFSFGTIEDWYYSGHPIELAWLWGYVALALGFDDQRKRLSPE